MQLYLATTPSEFSATSRYSRNLAHVAYRIGRDASLLRQPLPKFRGGLLCISDQNAPCICESDVLCAAVLRECGRRGYHGVLLDFEAPPQPDRIAFVHQLDAALMSVGRALYLPESYAEGTKHAVVLICTAVSGGSLTNHLKEAAKQYGGIHRLALDAQRICMDFCIPAPSGEGTPLTVKALQALMQQENPSLFFSSDLCCRYFTYTHSQTLHFVMLDDAETLKRKLHLGTELGIRTAFFMWPEIKDIAGELFQ